MGLDPQTERRLQELFGGRRCCRCGSPAVRLIDDRFYCQGHFLVTRRGPKGRPAEPADNPETESAATTNQHAIVSYYPMNPRTPLVKASKTQSRPEPASIVVPLKVMTAGSTFAN